MEHHIHNRDFERFVKQNADQYRMFPSEKVWEDIHSTLHTRKRRWYVIGLSLLLLTTAAVTGIMLIPSNRQLTGYKNLQASDIDWYEKAVAATDRIPAKDEATRFLRPGTSYNPFTTAPVTANHSDDLAVNSGIPDETAMEALPAISNIATLAAPQPYAIAENKTELALSSLFPEPARKTNPLPVTSRSGLLLATVTPVQTADPGTAPMVPVADPVQEKPAIAASQKKEADDPRLPQIRDRVVSIQQAGTRKKLSWQAYITPTVSYRTLAENDQYLSAARYNNIVNGGSAVIYPSDVNTMVNHRPDLGFQLGLRTAYPVSRWFSITGGLQLSVSKYDIKAYQHPAEMTTIALSNRNVSTVSNFRNTNGYRENWLRNFYFSASLPIGMELKLSDGNKNYFGIAGTLQPTYVLDNRAYLISSDYKNYAEMPSLTRRWNMNTSFEVFAQQRTGKVNWRVGPQVRYQLLSSFSSNYPIKEHLFDFGLKLGIQLQ